MRKFWVGLLFTWALSASAWATDVVIQSANLSWTGPTSNVEIRFFLSARLLTPENQNYPASSPSVGTTTLKWDCTVSAGILTIPSVTLPATTNAVGGGRVRYTAVFFNKATNTPIQSWVGYEYFQLPHTLAAPVTWTGIKDWNDRLGTATDPTTPYNRGELDLLLAGKVSSAQLDTKVSKAGDAVTGNISSSATPSASGHLVTKGYVDTAVSGVSAGTIPRYAYSSLPAASPGAVATVNDNLLGMWMRSNANKWYSITGGEVDADEYATLSAAVTAIGSTLVTLRISTQQVISSGTVTIPPTMTVKVVGNGSVAIADGARLDTKGYFEAPTDRQVFFFTGSGTGKATWGGVDCTSSCTQGNMMPAVGEFNVPIIWAKWYGVKGDWNGTAGTDDTAAIQKILDTVPSDGKVVFNYGLVCKTTADLNLKNRKGVVMGGLSGVREAGESGERPFTLVYRGAAGGTVLHIGQTRNSVFHNIFIQAGPLNAGTGADRGIWIDNGFGSGGGISSANYFNDVAVYGMGTRATFCGIDIGNAGNGNNDEFHEFDRCTVRGGYGDSPVTGNTVGIAVRLNHANVKKIRFNSCQFSQAQYCVFVTNGSFSTTGCSLGYSSTGYRLLSWSEPLMLLKDESEGLGQVLSISGGGSPTITFSHGRYDRDFNQTQVATAANPLFDWGNSAANIEILSTYLGNFYHDNTGAANAWFTNNHYLFKSNGVQGSLKMYGTNFGLGVSFYPGYLWQDFATLRKVEYEGMNLSVNPANGRETGALAMTSAGTWRHIAGVQQATDDANAAFAYQTSAQNSVFLGDGQLELYGIPNPVAPAPFYRPYARLFGANAAGSTQYNLSIMGVDAAGRRTLRSQYVFVATGAATLSGTDKIDLYWPALPGAASYIVLQANPANGEQFRSIGTPSTNSLSLTANPSGGYTYVVPTQNETMKTKVRGQMGDALTLAFTDGDTTPSVASANLFSCANASATTITTFDDGLVGQRITILFTNGNTTLANGANLKTRSGANVTPAANTAYSFRLIGNVWYEN